MSYQLDLNADWAVLPDAIRKGIRESDPHDVRPRDWQTISLALHDSRGAIVGGLYGATMWSWLMIDGLWVAPERRGQGLGRKLLLAAEETAVQRGCIGSWLGTFDFQARVFYERLGYSVFAELVGFPQIIRTSIFGSTSPSLIDLKWIARKQIERLTLFRQGASTVWKPILFFTNHRRRRDDRSSRRQDVG